MPATTLQVVPSTNDGQKGLWFESIDPARR
jgi:hypothetical protein